MTDIDVHIKRVQDYFSFSGNVPTLSQVTSSFDMFYNYMLHHNPGGDWLEPMQALRKMIKETP